MHASELLEDPRKKQQRPLPKPRKLKPKIYYERSHPTHGQELISTTNDEAFVTDVQLLAQSQSMTNMKFSSNQIHPQQSDFDDVNRVQQSSLMLNCLIESSTDKHRPQYSLEKMVPFVHPTNQLQTASNDEINITRTHNTTARKFTDDNDNESEHMPHSNAQHSDLNASHIDFNEPFPSARSRQQITLIERLTKTIHIWFLPNLSRPSVTHLLGSQSSGVFIIRSSSRMGGNYCTQAQPSDNSELPKITSTLALTVRMPADYNIDVDHYLIEVIDDCCVRLKGSPFIFNSLPQLLEHYHVDGEEIRVRLTLPEAIVLSTSIQELQALDLMGQDFWASHISRSFTTSNSDYANDSQSGMDYLSTCLRVSNVPKTRHSELRKGCSVNQSYCSMPNKSQPGQMAQRNTNENISKLVVMRPYYAEQKQKSWYQDRPIIKQNQNDHPIEDQLKFAKFNSRACHGGLRKSHSSYEHINSAHFLERDNGNSIPDGFHSLMRRTHKRLGSGTSFLRNIFSSSSTGNRTEHPKSCALKKASSLQEQSQHGSNRLKRSAAIILPSCQTGMLEKLANHQTLIPIDMTSHSRSEISKPEISPKPYILTRYNNSLNPSMTSFIAEEIQVPFNTREASKETNLNSQELFIPHEIKSLNNSNRIATVRPLSKNNHSNLIPTDQHFSYERRVYQNSDVSCQNATTTRSNNQFNLDSASICPSIAATEFNEPWDSTFWENLLNLANIGDQKGSTNLQPTKSNDLTQKGHIECPHPQIIKQCADKQNETGDETEEAVAMAVVLAGTGTNKTSWRHKDDQSVRHIPGSQPDDLFNEPVMNMGENRIKTPNSSPLIEDNNSINELRNEEMFSNNNQIPSFLLVENAAKAATSARMGERSSLNIEGLNVVIPKQNTQISPTFPQNMNSSHMNDHLNDDRDSDISDASTSLLTDVGRTLKLGSPVISPLKVKSVSNLQSEQRIRNYIEFISCDESHTVFGATIKRFIECTLNSKERDPFVTIRRVRQFIDGMKNYLVRNGEAELHKIITCETEQLNANEFLNIEAIFEKALDKILLKRLKPHLYRLMILELTRSGELIKLSESLSQIRNASPIELGFAGETLIPDANDSEAISTWLKRMQRHYSPQEKLKLLLKILSVVVPSYKNPSIMAASVETDIDRASQNSKWHQTTPVEDLIRWLVYIFARNLTINCEVEAWYIWELLPQQTLASGDITFYLTTLFSSIHTLKNPESLNRLKYSQDFSSMGSQTTLCFDDEFSDAFLKVAIPNECEGVIEFYTFPVLPKINTTKLCRVIANQFTITNPGDFGLYLLCDGYETLLSPTDLPCLLRSSLRLAEKPHLFAYKRTDIRIAWPKKAYAI